ncbi:hypothetical protein NRB20_30920 [Nocardia sp. RB20]|uniref:Uncharacterized protein n=1 Tax=Nocardia macrotermitis TaxID=2585198 RepID=A0A7K0D2V5_9NOCA|nr:hypothetical protein [Nocardia macrotermitis]
MYRPHQKYDRAEAVTVIGGPIEVKLNWDRLDEPTR